MCEKTERNIANCATYSDRYQCSGCEDEYHLNKNTCIACPASKYYLLRDFLLFIFIFLNYLEAYVPPTPASCPGNPGTNPGNSNSTNSTVSNSSNPSNPSPGTNGTTTSASILKITLALALIIALLF